MTRKILLSARISIAALGAVTVTAFTNVNNIGRWHAHSAAASMRLRLSAEVNPVERFVQAYNDEDLETCMACFSEDCSYEDVTFPKPFTGKASIQRHLYLQAQAQPAIPISKYTGNGICIDDMAVDVNKITMLYHLQNSNRRQLAFFTLEDNTLITSVFAAVEPSTKRNAADLKTLAMVSKILPQSKNSDTPIIATTTESKTPPEQYFAAWNQRDMDKAVQCFADTVIYDDTVFANPLIGKEALRNHLYVCADAFPESFRFCVDDVANGGNTIGVRWHVEQNGEPLPFTRGCSIYHINNDGLILDGLDMVEPAVLKLGGISLFQQTLQRNIIQEPIRMIPIVIWIAYIYIVFFSTDIIPGANLLQFEPRTWEEVRDLSLNFFFVAPMLNLPFSPTVHPILEGVFNLLLAWAALFAGFLSDDRPQKPNLLPYLPTVVGMQFLTSAFLLPYLATRTTETNDSVSRQDLYVPIAESKWLGVILGSVGVSAFAWGSLARDALFGGWSERVSSFWELMSIDRVGSSFLVDLAIFAIFQGWLVDDDLKSRGVPDNELGPLRAVAKFVPFFGMAAYLSLRPSYPSRDTEGDTKF